MMLRAARHFFNQCRLPKELSQDRRYDEFGLRVWNVAVHLSASQDFPAVARIATLTNGLAVRSDRGINTLAGQYSLAAPLGPKEYALFIEAEFRKWAPVIKASGASFD